MTIRRQDGNPDSKGLINASNRILQRLIDSPRFGRIAKASMASIDPTEARPLVRTLLWRDPDLSLSLAGMAPKAANVLIAAADTAVAEVSERISPEVVTEFVRSMLAEVDVASLRRLTENSRMLGQKLAPLWEELVQELKEGGTNHG